MYNFDYIYNKYGFEWIPKEIHRNLLYNIAYNPDSKEVKLYILDEKREFLFKVNQKNKSISKQFKGNLQPSRNQALLNNYLKTDINPSLIFVDTYEDNSLYLLVDQSSWIEYEKFFYSLCSKLNLLESDLLIMINRINNVKITSLYHSFILNAISLVRIPLNSKKVKIYSRPFRYNNGYNFQPSTEHFFQSCFSNKTDFIKYKPYFWIASDLYSDRIIISSQQHDLVF